MKAFFVNLALILAFAKFSESKLHTFEILHISLIVIFYFKGCFIIVVTPGTGRSITDENLEGFEENRNGDLSEGQMYALEMKAFEVCDTDADGGLSWEEVDRCIVRLFIR